MLHSTLSKIAVAAALLIGPVVAGAASAQTIPGLYDTGVASDGSSLDRTGATDLHYLVSVNGGTFRSAVTYTAGYYDGDGPARFISSDTNGGPGGYTDTYDYRLSFDLGNLDPATASIRGFWATDNSGTDITVNGVSSGSVNDTFFPSTPFVLSRGFQSGLNTIDFLVGNSGGPSALRVSGLSGTALPGVSGAVPETATWAMMILGMGAIGFAMRRRKVTARVSYAA